MKLVRAFAVAFGMSTLTATTAPARADATGDFAEKAMQLIERAATVIDMNKSDCDVMGDKLNKILDENAAFVADAKARVDKMSEAEKNALQARYRQRLMAVKNKMQDGMAKCAQNAKVASALRRVQ